MTDRELLELAAKAAGVAALGWNDGGEPYSSGIGFILPSGRVWNPLADDGDALRLAVKLYIGIRSNGPDDWQQPNTSVALYDGGEYGSGRVTIQHGDDPSIATRRAIVRAAAEVGRRMP